MKKLVADFDFREYATAYVFCHVFPVEKTKNGFYKCRLSFEQYSKKEKSVVERSIEWIIPAEYLEENGCVTANNDIYFARFLIKTHPDLYRDEDGNPKLDKYGNPRAGYFMHLGKLIEFWNTRVFGKPDKII